MRSTTRTTIFAALALALAAGTAATAEPTNPLGGPSQAQGSAAERAAEGREGFGSRRGQARPANEQNLMGYALRALDEAADGALKLTDEQRDALEEIRAEFEASVRVFREENAEELEAIQAQFRELRGALREGDEAARDAMATLREQMQQIRENAPQFADIRGSIEGVLTQDQLAFVAKSMEELREMAQQRGQRGDRRGPLEGMGQQRPGMAPGMGDAPGQQPQRPGARPGEGADRGAPQLRQLAQRLQNLPEEQRVRITELLQAMIAQAEADAGIDPDAAGDATNDAAPRRGQRQGARPGGDRQREGQRPGRRGGNTTDNGNA